MDRMFNKKKKSTESSSQIVDLSASDLSNLKFKLNF